MGVMAGPWRQIIWQLLADDGGPTIVSQLKPVCMVMVENVHQKKTTMTIYSREDSGLLWRIFVCALGYRSFVYFMRKEIFGTDSSHLDDVNNYLLPNSNSLQSTFLLLVAHSFERETTVLLRGKQALASSVWENNKVGDIDSSIPPQICVFFFQTTSSAHSPPAVALTTSSGFLEF